MIDKLQEKIDELAKACFEEHVKCAIEAGSPYSDNVKDTWNRILIPAIIDSLRESLVLAGKDQ